MDELTQTDLLELDIDLRMSDLWQLALEIEDNWDLETVVCFMRAAYGKGYTDAHAERSPGKLFSEHGYQFPEKAL